MLTYHIPLIEKTLVKILQLDRPSVLNWRSLGFGPKIGLPTPVGVDHVPLHEHLQDVLGLLHPDLV